MRIRTIKPEFWTHPIMARQDCEVRLLALALLNYADDEGFFNADADLVRAALMPFKRSPSPRRGIDEASHGTRTLLEQLSILGWIDLREHPERGFLGQVKNFQKHQAIDRPTASKIREYFDSCEPKKSLDEASTSARVKLIDGSLWEQGTGNREQSSAGHEKIADQPKEPKPPRKPSEQQNVFAWCQLEAQKLLPQRVPEKPPEPATLNSQLKAPLLELGRHGLEAAWREFLRDDFARQNAWAWNLFAAQISKHFNASVARVGPVPKPKPKIGPSVYPEFVPKERIP